jgi:type IV fimbrial biogenesis protein FimT
MLRKNRLSASVSAMQGSLNLARSEAVTRGADARITIAANGTAGSWTNGWTVFVDQTTTANNGVAPTVDVPTTSANSVTRLSVMQALPSGVTTGSTGGLAYFIYNGQGRVIDTNGANANRQFWFTDGVSGKYCLIISSTGRVRAATVDQAANCATD